MSASTQNGGGIEHWLAEEMKLWHVLPLFLALALLGWGMAEVAALFVATNPQLPTLMISAAGLFAGFAMGWTARRYKEEDKIGSH